MRCLFADPARSLQFRCAPIQGKATNLVSAAGPKGRGKLLAAGSSWPREARIAAHIPAPAPLISRSAPIISTQQLTPTRACIDAGDGGDAAGADQAAAGAGQHDVFALQVAERRTLLALQFARRWRDVQHLPGGAVPGTQLPGLVPALPDLPSPQVRGVLLALAECHLPVRQLHGVGVERRRAASAARRAAAMRT